MRLLRSISFAAGICVGMGATALTPAMAQDRSFGLSPASLAVGGTATQTSTVNLPKSGTGIFYINFVVPSDHAPNTNITVSVYMQAPVTSCTAATKLSSVTRRRVGSTSYNTSAPNVDRVAPFPKVETTAFPAAGTIVAKNYIVRRPQSGPFTKLLAGDGIGLRVDRVSTDPADTCDASVFVSHFGEKYTSVAAP